MLVVSATTTDTSGTVHFLQFRYFRSRIMWVLLKQRLKHRVPKPTNIGQIGFWAIHDLDSNNWEHPYDFYWTQFRSVSVTVPKPWPCRSTSLASNMGSGMFLDFTRAPSTLRFTCNHWTYWTTNQRWNGRNSAQGNPRSQLKPTKRNTKPYKTYSLEWLLNGFNVCALCAFQVVHSSLALLKRAFAGSTTIKIDLKQIKNMQWSQRSKQPVHWQFKLTLEVAHVYMKWFSCMCILCP